MNPLSDKFLMKLAEKNLIDRGELLISKGADINAKAIIYLNIKIIFFN